MTRRRRAPAPPQIYARIWAEALHDFNTVYCLTLDCTFSDGREVRQGVKFELWRSVKNVDCVPADVRQAAVSQLESWLASELECAS